MKHPTDEEIEKYTMQVLTDQNLLPNGYAHAMVVIKLVLGAAKWARDQQPKWIDAKVYLPSVSVKCLVTSGEYIEIAYLTTMWSKVSGNIMWQSNDSGDFLSQCHALDGIAKTADYEQRVKELYV